MLLSIVKHIVKDFVSVDKLANHQSSVFQIPAHRLSYFLSSVLFSFVFAIIPLSWNIARLLFRIVFSWVVSLTQKTSKIKSA